MKKFDKLKGLHRKAGKGLAKMAAGQAVTAVFLAEDIKEALTDMTKTWRASS